MYYRTTDGKWVAMCETIIMVLTSCFGWDINSMNKSIEIDRGEVFTLVRNFKHPGMFTKEELAVRCRKCAPWEELCEHSCATYNAIRINVFRDCLEDFLKSKDPVMVWGKIPF